MYQYQYELVLDSVPLMSTAQITMSPPPSTAEQNEDWTQIADLTLRRRIQNRIAQRNYRNKLKRRLRELEKLAATSEGSLPTTKCENQTQALKQDINKYSTPTLKKSAAPEKISAPRPTAHNGGVAFPQTFNTEDPNRPPCIPYWSSLPQDQSFLQTYAYTQSYPVTTMVGDYPSYVNATSALYTPGSIMQLDNVNERM